METECCGDRVAIDDERDRSIRENSATRDRCLVGDVGRQRPRDELALADELVDGEREPMLVRADEDGVGRRLAAALPERPSRRR